MAAATGKDYYDLILGEDGVFSKVEDDGYGVSGAIAPMTFKSKLRGLRDTTGQPIFIHNMQDSTSMRWTEHRFSSPRTDPLCRKHCAAGCRRLYAGGLCNPSGYYGEDPHRGRYPGSGNQRNRL
ncbi:MAG: hypothetical protein V8S98_13400 [Lachnospiraceae bacterium]